VNFQLSLILDSFASVGKYVHSMQTSPVSARMSATREDVVFDL
jgi:hypothetical protein